MHAHARIYKKKEKRTWRLAPTFLILGREHPLRERYSCGEFHSYWLGSPPQKFQLGICLKPMKTNENFIKILSTILKIMILKNASEICNKHNESDSSKMSVHIPRIQSRGVKPVATNKEVILLT